MSATFWEVGSLKARSLFYADLSKPSYLIRAWRKDRYAPRFFTVKVSRLLLAVALDGESKVMWWLQVINPVHLVRYWSKFAWGPHLFDFKVGPFYGGAVLMLDRSIKNA